VTNRRQRLLDLLRTLADVIRLSWEAAPSTLVTALVLAGFQAVVPPVMVWLGKVLVDLVVKGASGGTVSGADVAPTVVALGIGAAVLRVATTVAGHRQRLYATVVELHAERRILERLASLDVSHFDRPDWYDQVARATRDLAWRPYGAAWTLVSMTGSLVALAGMLVLLSTLSPLLALLGLLAVMPTAVLHRRFNQQLYRFFKESTADERQRKYLGELLTQGQTAREMKVFDVAGEVLERHRGLSEKRLGVMRELQSRADRKVVFGALLSGASLAAAYGLVASRGLAGDFTAGDLAIVIGAFSAVTTQMSGVFQSMFELDQNASFLADYFAFVRTEPESAGGERQAELPGSLEGGVNFEGVTFTYPGQAEPVLRGVDLHVGPGQLLALVGQNAAGKTTLVKLLLRFYEPDDGSITVAGVDVRQLDPRRLRARIGVMFQDFARYELTVRDNVGFGRPEREPTDEAVMAAVRGADAEAILLDLQQGLDSNVGPLFEGGHDLSGGEWQRLALARLLFRDADIWILDEPTSALDAEIEAALFGRLRTLLRDRIGIILSHRFSTVRAADVIAVVDEGRIAEFGTHDELIAAQGKYAQMFNRQAAAYR